MKNLFLILLALLIPVTAMAQGESCFIGAWNLESVTDPDGVITYPGDLGIYSQVQFLGDSSFARLENLSIVAQGTWQVGTVLVQYHGAWVCLDTLSTSAGDSWHSAALVEPGVLELLRGIPGAETRERYVFVGPTSGDRVSLGAMKSLYR
jgi:hypothetical protein